jgi:CRP-like cAMP-binding protein
MNHFLTSRHSGGLEPFARCTRKELALIESLSTELTVPAGKVLARRGAIGREYVVIVDGSAAAVIEGRVVEHLGAGDDFGGSPIACSLQHAATIVAETPMTVRVMSVPEFRTAYDSVPSLQFHVDGELARRAERWTRNPAPEPVAPVTRARAGAMDYTLAS